MVSCKGRTRSFVVLCVVGILNCSALMVMLLFYNLNIPVIRKRVTNELVNFTLRCGCENNTSTKCFSAINESHSDIPRCRRNETKDSSVQRNATFRNVRGALSGFTSLKDLYDTIDRNWSFNATEADNWRSILERYCNTSELFLVTGQNVQPGQELRYTVKFKKTFAITKKINQRFIKKMPYHQKSFKKCSVVGNSGILLGSKCGKAIDNADYIFRYNAAPVRGYSEDVGSKTSLVTCNPSILEHQFDSLNEQESERFEKYMTKEYDNAYILLPAFSKTRGTELAFKAQDILKPTNLKVIYTHPYFQTLVWTFWTNQKNLMAEMTTSGMTVFTAAMSFCEEVHLYGYWPFAEDPDGNPTYFHYFNKTATMSSPEKLQAVHHNMPSEFKLYMALHNKGAIKLHVGQCDV
ncbi:alpha-2,8-sialyltransferase 8E-like [Ptychodera flava]|uniref:alpha-2,8-sialyltransferase 8E-like n=1 Tax=Ptychodera flava TaxID=63121 RepID=UPI00396A5BA6